MGEEAMGQPDNAGSLAKSAETPVKKAFSRQGVAIDKLEIAIQNLTEKIAPVLAPDIPKDAVSEGKADAAEPSEVVKEIDRRTWKIRSAAISIRELTERVEL